MPVVETTGMVHSLHMRKKSKCRSFYTSHHIIPGTAIVHLFDISQNSIITNRCKTTCAHFAGIEQKRPGY